MVRRLSVAAIVATAAIGVMALQGGASSKQAALAEDQVRAAFTLAMRVDQGVQAPSVVKAGEAPTDAKLKQQLTEGTAAIHAIFAEEPAARVIKGLNNAVESQKASGDKFHFLGAGIGRIEFKELSVQGSAATIHAIVETWSRMEVKQAEPPPLPASEKGVASPPLAGTGLIAGPPGHTAKWIVSEPHNLLDVTMTLVVDASGNWIVQTYNWTFVGGGP